MASVPALVRPERHRRSELLYRRALRRIPGGVNSTARATWSGWEPYPLFVRSGDGAYITDVDGNTYVDYLLGLGPMLLGHRPPAVTEAVVRFLRERGSVFALPVEEELELAERLAEAVPSVDQVRLTNSGTEAVMYAVRLARAYTGRPLLVRFEGMYHGFSDVVYWSKHPPLEEAGPDEAPVPVPQGPGLPPGLERSLVVLPWNDADALERLLAERGHEVAAVITEPVMCNTGCILPEPGYLERMRELTLRHGVVLIYDEVITGFRMGLGGAQGHYGIRPDLTVFAKGLGGGFPIAALGGRGELMEKVADGTVSMAGTYAANGIAVSAGIAALTELARPGVQEELFRQGERLRVGLSRVLREAGLPVQVVGIGGVFQVWFSTRPIRSYRDAVRHARQDLFRLWWEEMLDRGILFHPGPFENLFLSTRHGAAEIDRTLQMAAEAAQAVRRRAQAQGLLA
jgi:glutamate-1-semialdehyde 2,1-aminomutase